jgi:hypothetical protein
VTLTQGRRLRPSVPHGDDPVPVPARVSFPRGTWLVIGLFALFLGATLGGQFLLIQQQRDLARQQRNIAATTLRLVDPFLDDARPLADRTRRRLPATEAAARRADRLVRSALPLVQSATPLVQHLDAEGLSEAARATRQLVAAVLSNDLPDAIADLLPQLAEATRVVDRLDGTQVRALALLRTAVELQRQALATNRETLAVAKRTEGHAANLDRKFGGEAPAAGLLAP